MAKARKVQHFALGVLLAVALVTVGCGSSSGKTKFRNPPLSIESSVLLAGQAGAFLFRLAEASGGQRPHAWTVEPSSMLPAGLTLGPQGDITGIPAGVGSFSFDLRVTDDFGTNLVGTHTIDITSGAPPVITTTTLMGGAVGTPYSDSVVATGGFFPIVFTVSVGTLPSGLTLNNSSGEIFGTPRLTGLSSFDVTVTDSQSNMDSASLSIDVIAGVPANHLLINEIFTGGTRFVEIANPTGAGQDLTGWSLEWYWQGILMHRFYFPTFTLPSNEAIAVR